MAVGDTPTYTPSPPTIGPQTEDGRNIVDWVQRELHNIASNLGAQSRLQITPVSAPPSTPREGLLAYADGISWNPNNSGKGLTVYDAAITSWIQFPQLQVQTIGDANYSIRPQDELIIITGFTAPRTWTLPPPNTFAGRELIITGIPGALSAVNTLTIQHNSTEFIDQPPLGLSGTTAVINTPMPYVRITCDGFNWFLVQLTPFPLSIATTAQYLNNTANLVLETDKVWAAAAWVTTTFAATVTLDFSTFINTKMTFGAGNVTFANPSNMKAGQVGIIALTQDGVGSRTASWGTNFHVAGGAAPVLSTAPNARDLIGYVGNSATDISIFMLAKNA